MPVGSADLAIAIWFGLSILVQIATTASLIGWLERRAEKLEWSMRMVPGYAELIYHGWCRSHGRSPALVLTLRVVSLVNLVLAVYAFFRVFVK